MLDNTICAPATVPGTGAISVVRVSGPDALAIADKVVILGRQADGYGSAQRADDGGRAVPGGLIGLPPVGRPYPGKCPPTAQPRTPDDLPAAEQPYPGKCPPTAQPRTPDDLPAAGQPDPGKCPPTAQPRTPDDLPAASQTGPGEMPAYSPATPAAGLAETPGYSIRFGRVYSGGQLLDEVLVSVFRAPHSYTGEDSVEISCHASRYIVETLLSLLVDAGCTMAGPGEFTRRAFLAGKMDLAQAEAVADVIASSSKAAHRVAMNQMKGGFSDELGQLREALLHIASLMELELDFSEEEVEFADRSELRGLVDRLSVHMGRLIDSFRLGNAIKNGIPVAIAGAPNSGKSTLLNALVGEDRAIVSDIPGTTRDTIEETMVIDGVLFRFIDTAGIRHSDNTIERLGIERSFRELSRARIILGVVDLSSEDIEGQVRMIKEAVEGGADGKDHGTMSPDGQKLILVMNKADLAGSDSGEDGLGTDSGTGTLGDDSVANGLGTESGAETLGGDSGEDGLGTGSGTETLGGDSGEDGLGTGSGTETLGGDSVEGNDGRVVISAATGAGIDTLRKRILDAAGIDDSQTLVTNLRHAEALRAAQTSLSRVREGLDTSLPTDLIAQDLREAVYHLGTITGAISTDEVLGNIFSKFCIGK